MSDIDHLINCISILGEILLCVFALQHMLRSKNGKQPAGKRRIAGIVYLIFYVTAMFLQEFYLNRLISDTYWLYLLMHILLLTGFALIFCAGRTALQIILPLNLVSFLSLSRAPARLIALQLNKFLHISWIQSTMQGAFLVIFILIILFLLSLKFDPETDYPVSYYVTLFFAPPVSLANTLQFYFQSESDATFSTVSGIISLLFQLLLFYMVSQSTREYQSRMRLELIAQRLDYQDQYMQQLQDIVNEYHQIRHDMKNHIAIMDHMLSRNRYDDLKQYFYSFNQSIYALDNQIETGNETVNEVFSIKYATAKRAGIPIEFETQIPHSLPVPDHLLCSLLANLLDNAIEASEKIEHPEIRVEMKTVKDYLSVTVKNRIEEWQKENLTSRKTSKADDQLHGLGMQIIEDITAKYNGISSYKIGEDTYTASIMLDIADT